MVRPSQVLISERLVQDTIRVLAIPGKRYKKPLVILLVGPPASGKTLIAKEIERRLPFCRLTADVIRAFLVPSPTFNVQETAYVTSLLEGVLKRLIRLGVSVIYDVNLAKFEERQRVRRLVKGLGGQVFLIELTCQDRVAFARIEKRNEEIQRGLARGRIIDREYYRFMRNSIEPPISREGAVVIDTSYALKGFEELLVRLKRAL